VIRIDYESRHAIAKTERSKLIDNIRLAVDAADAIIVSDYGYGVVDQPLYEEIRNLAVSTGIPLVVDSRYRLGEFHGADSATPNQEEVEQLLGASFSDDDCNRLCERLGFRSLVVTRGNKGMTIFEPGRTAVDLQAVGSTQPVDVTGAGDTVIAAYSLALAAGMNFLDAAAIANHAGGIVVMKKGTATASNRELIGSLNASDRPAAASDFAA
jgi:rfaE bifunctional protein kinase chain/domain